MIQWSKREFLSKIGKMFLRSFGKFFLKSKDWALKWFVDKKSAVGQSRAETVNTRNNLKNSA